ncbi:hypothetical protein SAMN04488515_1730 [Cognatiyoonia koreensis]|uniref:Transferrin-binding protein B C-lobe/N-lobe beta barrel domain-containing protein n=1 Tax=Cognatiyoonia koreensis TaxID=364200 RepID=A0A1I0Q7L0_9RHOB|nr:hypothetical protein [Cognatiyoonia koreensis]SEW22976.1 hypothetical protein SAMN04488515_1730 [Cognatiyoonia koreensis]
MKLATILPLGAIAFTAACGGSSTNSNTNAGTPEQTAQLQAFLTTGEDISDRIETFINDDEFGALPDNGDASYSGVSLVVVGTGDPSDEGADTSVDSIAVGSFEADVDFQRGELNGSATDFIEIANASEIFGIDTDEDDFDIKQIESGGAVSGTLDFEARGPDPVFSDLLAVGISGHLSDQAGNTLTLQNLAGEAEFFGPDEDIVEIFAADTLQLDNAETGFVSITAIGDK